MIKSCTNCGGEYTSASNAQKFCSRDCRGKHPRYRGYQRKASAKKRAMEPSAERRDRNLQYKYGITLDEWEAMFEAQGRKCYFGCETTGNYNWATDHDHETGKVRSILCDHHNRVLGYIEAHRDELTDLLLYIETHKLDTATTKNG